MLNEYVTPSILRACIKHRRVIYKQLADGNLQPGTHIYDEESRNFDTDFTKAVYSLYGRGLCPSERLIGEINDCDDWDCWACEMNVACEILKKYGSAEYAE